MPDFPRSPSSRWRRRSDGMALERLEHRANDRHWFLALVTGYLFITRTSAFSPQKASFIAGAVVLFVALGPPLDDWSDHYLLLAHMVQHLLLIMLAAPLLLYGTPAWMLEPLTRNRITNAIGYWLTRPVIAYAMANAVFVLWHVPCFTRWPCARSRCTSSST